MKVHFWEPKERIENGFRLVLQCSAAPCGEHPPADRRTEDPEDVTCKRCKKTKVWWRAWKSRAERVA